MRERWRVQRAAGSGLLGSGWLAPLLGVSRISRGFYAVEFLGGGLRAGLLQRLASGPVSLDALAAAHAVGPELRDGLASWLELGVGLGLVRREGERFALRGLARALVKPENDPVAAFVDEVSSLHHRLVGETPARLAEGRPFELGDTDAELIARSSVFAEPYIAAALAEVVPASGPVRLVEVGCGSGVHMATAARLNPALTARGLELQPDAAALARRNLAGWGLADRVGVEVADVRDVAGTGDADLVTLHQNIYYFPLGERVALFRHLAGFLAPGGRLLVTSVCRGPNPAAAALDLWGAMTRGADRLPVPEELVAQLAAAGLVEARAIPVASGGLFTAFVARRP